MTMTERRKLTDELDCESSELGGFDKQASKFNETLTELRQGLGVLDRANADFQKAAEEARDKCKAVASVLQSGKFYEARFVRGTSLCNPLYSSVATGNGHRLQIHLPQPCRRRRRRCLR